MALVAILGRLCPLTQTQALQMTQALGGGGTKPLKRLGPSKAAHLLLSSKESDAVGKNELFRFRPHGSILQQTIRALHSCCLSLLFVYIKLPFWCLSAGFCCYFGGAGFFPPADPTFLILCLIGFFVLLLAVLCNQYLIGSRVGEDLVHILSFKMLFNYNHELIR